MFIFSPSSYQWPKVWGLLFIPLLLIGLIAAFILAQKNQDVRQRADSTGTPNVRLSLGSATNPTGPSTYQISPNSNWTLYIWAHNPNAATTSPITAVHFQLWFDPAFFPNLKIEVEPNSWRGKTPAILKAFSTIPAADGGKLALMTIGTHCDSAECYSLTTSPVKIAKVTFSSVTNPPGTNTGFEIVEDSYVAVMDKDDDWLMNNQSSHSVNFTYPQSSPSLLPTSSATPTTSQCQGIPITCSGLCPIYGGQTSYTCNWTKPQGATEFAMAYKDSSGSTWAYDVSSENTTNWSNNYSTWTKSFPNSASRDFRLRIVESSSCTPHVGAYGQIRTVTMCTNYNNQCPGVSVASSNDGLGCACTTSGMRCTISWNHIPGVGSYAIAFDDDPNFWTDKVAGNEVGSDPWAESTTGGDQVLRSFVRNLTNKKMYVKVRVSNAGTNSCTVCDSCYGDTASVGPISCEEASPTPIPSPTPLQFTITQLKDELQRYLGPQNPNYAPVDGKSNSMDAAYILFRIP